MEATAANPLSRLAWSVPAQAAPLGSVLGRLLGALAVAAVVFDQSYDATQVFAGVVAGLVVAASLVPARGTTADCLAAFGAGLAFFAGAVVTHLELGVAALAAGSLAGLAALAAAHRARRDATLPAVAFLGAVLLVGGLQVLIVFTFE